MYITYIIYVCVCECRIITGVPNAEKNVHAGEIKNYIKCAILT